MITAEYNQAKNTIDNAISAGTYAKETARMATQYYREGNMPAAKAAYICSMSVFFNNLIIISDLPKMPSKEKQAMSMQQRLQITAKLMEVTYGIRNITSDLDHDIEQICLEKQELKESLWYYECIHIGNMQAISESIERKADRHPENSEINKYAKRLILQCYESVQKHFQNISDDTMRIDTMSDEPPFPQTKEQTFLKTFHNMNRMRDAHTKIKQRLDTIENQATV